MIWIQRANENNCVAVLPAWVEVPHRSDTRMGLWYENLREHGGTPVQCILTMLDQANTNKNLVTSNAVIEFANFMGIGSDSPFFKQLTPMYTELVHSGLNATQALQVMWDQAQTVPEQQIVMQFAELVSLTFNVPTPTLHPQPGLVTEDR